ncbi:MAG: hypothetical protein ACOC8B_07115, partial [Gemmatimonadota bacterium]
LRAAVETDLLPLAIVLVLASVVSYYYYLRVAWYMWFRDAESQDAHSDVAVPRTLRTVLVGAAVAVVAVGVFPGQLVEIAERSAGALVEATSGVVMHVPTQ